MTLSFSHRSVNHVPGTNCSLCLGIDRDSSRHLVGCNTPPGVAMSGNAAR